MKGRWKRKRVLGKWEQERGDLMKERGIGEERRETMGYKEVERKDRELLREERWRKIRESKYNKWYKFVKGEAIPEYLEKGWVEGRWRRVWRFRIGSEIRERKYWEKEEKRKCRMCGEEEETWEHVWEECMRWEGREEVGWAEIVEKMLGEGGEGEE
ncbi:hypothetical protein EAI_01473 [Harpegnathos saltator]|uniref:Uncharacterized protein n=1 Tax=Harpegnathos saltator TaxID=610380 RepID=E2BDJ8_HARSA|nr:hypothetical protein EAI_01473 [Harpegnathos saltator]